MDREPELREIADPEERPPGLGHLAAHDASLEHRPRDGRAQREARIDALLAHAFLVADAECPEGAARGAKLGIGPGYGGTVRLPRLVGKGRALDLLLTARMVGADEALQMGLVNRVVPADKLMAESEQLLRTILANGPLAVRLCIEAVDAGLEMSLEEALLLEANHFGLLASTDDMREGMGAFLEKRTASFRGS